MLTVKSKTTYSNHSVSTATQAATNVASPTQSSLIPEFQKSLIPLAIVCIALISVLIYNKKKNAFKNWD
jgi:hypothetical protein